MTAIDELRRLLDERGVQWSTSGNSTTRWRVGETACRWDVWGGRPRLLMSGVTPAQAIAATLGRGTCSIKEHFGEWYCTGCGAMVGTCDPTSELHIDGNAVELWNFCPNCGREVVE